MTPLLQVPRLAQALELDSLWIKDEGRNPTGSFKSRGMAIAVARAAELGAPALAAPSAGNAGLALAAYAARHGIPAIVAFPEDIPDSYPEACRGYGAEVLVSGATIREAGEALRVRVQQDATWREAFDLSTLREPYRLEGKKTMGYEIAEQMNDKTPDAVLYPTGGGTGLIGIAKAFEEMSSLGWIEEASRPRMIAVQMTGCSPIVDAWRQGRDHAVAVDDPQTLCWGLRVPSPFADREILTTLRSTDGLAVSISEEELRPTADELLHLEGIDVSPEGAAAVAAARQLVRLELLSRSDRVVILNTASSRMYT